MRGNHLEQVPEDRWETVLGWTERLDADTIKITVEGRTAAPRSQLFGADRQMGYGQPTTSPGSPAGPDDEGGS